MRTLSLLLLLLPWGLYAQSPWRWAIGGSTCSLTPFEYADFGEVPFHAASPYDFQFDTYGNLYMCGYYNTFAASWDGIFRLGNASIKKYTTPANAQYGFYIAKIDPTTGNTVWIQSIRSEGMHTYDPIRMKVAADGRKIYLSMQAMKNFYIDDNLVDTKVPEPNAGKMIVALSVDGFLPAFSKLVLVGSNFENMVVSEADNAFLVKDGNDDNFQDYTQYMISDAGTIAYQKPLKGFYASEKIVYYDAATGHYVSNWLSRFDATLKLVSSITSAQRTHLNNQLSNIKVGWFNMNRFWIDSNGNQYLLYGQFLEKPDDFFCNWLVKLDKNHQVLWKTPLFSAPYTWSYTLAAPDANGNPWLYMKGSGVGDVQPVKDSIPSNFHHWTIQEIDPATGKAGKRRLAPTDMLQGGIVALGFAVSKSNHFYVGGSYQLLTSFGNTTLTNTCSNKYHTMLYYLASSTLPPLSGRIAKNITAYPNPTNGRMVVDEDISQADLYHHSGIWMGRLQIENDRELDVSEYGSGLYYLRLLTSEGVQQIKIIKQ